MSERVLSALLLTLALAGQESRRQGGLADLSIEELMNIEVTSVAKKQQKLSEASAAVYVITQEDIRRSGATSIPEALRMAPGLHVARIDSNKWAITARGFNGRFANKMLVLVDGRSVYSPLFSGVYWDSQDTLLEDIERIEVIRGPGATMWGANAVNGVINIITRHASQTQDSLIVAGGGTEDQALGGVRVGGKLATDAWYRVYSKYNKRSELQDEFGHGAHDGWSVLRGGFRADWQRRGVDSFTMEGDFYGGRAAQISTLPSSSPPFSTAFQNAVRPSGGNLLGRWQRTFAESSGMDLQVYYDRWSRREGLGSEKRRTFDVDLHHDRQIRQRHQLLWGLEYRLTADELTGSAAMFDPPSRGDHLLSGFLQDEVTIQRDRLGLMLGTKLEHNDYTGFEIEPTARLLWTPNRRCTAWTAVSRAVRTPARKDHDVRADIATLPTDRGLTTLTILGNRKFRSETVVAHEAGFRVQPGRQVSLDVAGFYNLYDDLETTEPQAPVFADAGGLPRLIVPFRLENQGYGSSYGAEVAAVWAVTTRWRLQGWYSWLHLQLHVDRASRDPTRGERFELGSPRHQANIRSYLNLPRGFACDLVVYAAGSLEPSLFLGARQLIPGRVRLDARLSRQFGTRVEISVGLQNLLGGQWREFTPEAYGYGSLVGRSAYAKLTWWP